MPTRQIETRFWTITQNNSQGVFDHDPEHGIGYALCVEALNQADAEARLDRIINGYDQGPYCPCCGERWSVWFWQDEGSEQPEKYGEPLTGGWGMPSYVHYLDGRIEARAGQVSA